MGLREFPKELQRRRVYGVAVAYVAAAAVLPFAAMSAERDQQKA
jgi:hypothetical protein